jgi:hypothetical protein
MSRSELESQTSNAMEFIQKLFFEISYLIKEVEGLLGQESEDFVIGRPSGYGVTSGKSSGLEASNVELWLAKSFTVFFVPAADTHMVNGQTNTLFKDSLRILLLDIQLDGKSAKKPRISAGLIYEIVNRRSDQTKFEQLMFEFVNNREKIFAADTLNYSDSYTSMRGKLFDLPLFSIDSSEDVETKIVEPMLKRFRAN